MNSKNKTGLPSIIRNDQLNIQLFGADVLSKQQPTSLRKAKTAMI